jgi:hypothetical protein
MSNEKYKVTYTLVVEYENVNLPGEPKSSITMHSFDGTDDTITTVLDQIAIFLKAAGYYFDHLEVVKDANSYKV